MSPKGCTRGIYGLQSWKPLPRPASARTTNTTATANGKPPTNGGAKADPRIGRVMKSKYNYKANPDSPIGKELSFRLMEELIFVSAHDEHWIRAQKVDSGEEGFVPLTYMLFEEAAPRLPWLANQELKNAKEGKKMTKEDEAVAKMPYKKYVSAYEKKEKVDPAADDTVYRCDMCDKTLNGPHPYNMHMNSKAHKEMVELMAEYEQDNK